MTLWSTLPNTTSPMKVSMRVSNVDRPECQVLSKLLFASYEDRQPSIDVGTGPMNQPDASGNASVAFKGNEDIKPRLKSNKWP